VSNDADRIAALKEVIDMFGYPVLIFQCETLEEAITFIGLQPDPVELLFVDVGREEKGGVTLLKRLQQFEKSETLVISVLNAFGIELPERALRKAGVKYFMTAPLTELTLLWNVGMALSEGL